MLKNIIYCYLSFGLLSLMPGCTSTTEQDNSENVLPISKYFTSEIKEIKLDPLSNVQHASFQYYESKDSSEYLYLLNTATNSIEQYSWESGVLEQKIILEKEGPNGVSKVTNFYIHNSDSIFVVATYSFTVSLINKEGKVLRKYSLLTNESQKEKLGEGVISYGDEAGKISLINNQLILPAAPFDDPNLASYYARGSFGVCIDLMTGKTNTLFSAPEHWHKNFTDGFRLTSQENIYGQDINKSKNTCIMSFPTEDYIYEVDLRTQKTTKHFAKSSQLSTIPWMSRKITDMEEEFNFFYF